MAQRSNEDKRRAVMALILDKELSGWSDHELARRAEVSRYMVSLLRPPANERRYRTRWGSPAIMNISSNRARRK